MFKLYTKFGADSLLYLLSHFEWNGHTVHMLTQQHLPPPLTSTVKSSLFTHVELVQFFKLYISFLNQQYCERKPETKEACW